MSNLKKPRYLKTSFDLLTPEEQAQVRVRGQLVEKASLAYRLWGWLLPTLALAGVSLGFYLLNASINFDWSLKDRFFDLVLTTHSDSMNNATSSFVELSAALLGIVITVVAIVLQLAAQRYGARLVDLFLADTVNRLYFFLMVFVLSYNLLIEFGLKEGNFPKVAIEAGLVITLFEIALLAPYFLYVFRFLTPTNLLTAIQQSNIEIIQEATQTEGLDPLRNLQKEASQSLEQVVDSALSANSQMDRNLGLMAINQIREMVLDYLDQKRKLPEEWFLVPEDHFIGIATEFYQEICEKRLWFEAKAFMDMELIYKSAIRTMPDAVSAIAFNSRILGEVAIRNQDDHLLDMVVQFFNTFIRISLNEKNVRAIFNLFYQYRLLTEEVFTYNEALAQKILFYIKYYGETCLQQGLFFVMYTAAYDLEALVAKAYEKELSNIKDLLTIFLGLEDNVDPKKDFFAFTGVRKAQIILATYLYSRGDRELIQMILEDLKAETVETLIGWRDALLSITNRKFWEITDRGVNMEYIDPEQKKYLSRFYEEYILSQPDQFGRHEA